MTKLQKKTNGMAALNSTELGKIKTATTYNSAADHFDDAPLAFWRVIGQRTIQRLQLKVGATVLDVGCGTGASAIPAAEAVGTGGKVIGVDLAERLLELARRKAARRHLDNVEFRLGDMTALGFPDAHFDAVVSVFSIFFTADMEATVRELWRMVKPGGKLAITTWGNNFFAPIYDVWRAAIQAERTDLYSSFHPWDRISTPEQVQQLLHNAGIAPAEITPEEGRQALRTPDEWWTVVLGSGLRATVDAMDTATAERIRQCTVIWLREHNITAIETNVIYAVAVKGNRD